MSLRPLSGLDAGFLYLEAAGTPMHIGSLMLLEVPRKRGHDFLSSLRAHVTERLPHAPPLRRLLQSAPLELGHPMWAETAKLDLDWHVCEHKLPRPVTAAKLNAIVGRLHAEALPRDRPLWQFVVIRGLESGLVAMYAKIHHALLDGQGGVALAQALLDFEAHPPPRAPAVGAAAHARIRRRDVARTTVDATVRQLANMLRELPATLRLAAGAATGPGNLLSQIRESVLAAPRTPFNAQVGPSRSFATATLALDAVKLVARGYEVSLNDVVMALCAGALREHLIRRRKLPEQPLVAAMPVSLRETGNTVASNQVSMVQCTLATNVADPVERLRAIKASTAQIKARVAVFRSLIPTDFPGLAAPIWVSGLSRLWSQGRVAERLPPLANLAISNVPGPPMHLFLAGARLRHYHPVSIVTHGLALNITVQSYAGQLEFGIVACKDALPNADSLALGLARALRALEKRLPA